MLCCCVPVRVDGGGALSRRRPEPGPSSLRHGLYGLQLISNPRIALPHTQGQLPVGVARAACEVPGLQHPGPRWGRAIRLCSHVFNPSRATLEGVSAFRVLYAPVLFDPASSVSGAEQAGCDCALTSSSRCFNLVSEVPGRSAMHYPLAHTPGPRSRPPRASSPPAGLLCAGRHACQHYLSTLWVHLGIAADEASSTAPGRRQGPREGGGAHAAAAARGPAGQRRSFLHAAGLLLLVQPGLLTAGQTDGATRCTAQLGCPSMPAACGDSACMGRMTGNDPPQLATCITVCAPSPCLDACS